jgi:hypothetical protein
MQGIDTQDSYPGKVADRALTQRVKDTYNDVEMGMRGYKVASIHNGAEHLSCQLIVGKIFVDLTGKFVEGLQMN